MANAVVTDNARFWRENCQCAEPDVNDLHDEVNKLSVKDEARHDSDSESAVLLTPAGKITKLLGDHDKRPDRLDWRTDMHGKVLAVDDRGHQPGGHHLTAGRGNDEPLRAALRLRQRVERAIAGKVDLAREIERRAVRRCLDSRAARLRGLRRRAARQQGKRQHPYPQPLRHGPTLHSAARKASATRSA